MNISYIKELKNKKVLVIGLGKSGISVIKGIAVFAGAITAIDSNPLLELEPQIKDINKSGRLELEVILDSNANSNTGLLEKIDLVIVSPGVPGDIPLIKAADSNRIPVWSEIEMGWRMLGDEDRNRTIAVTGTNGKTTVVTLLQQILSGSGRNSIVCGNIGNPLSSTLNNAGNNNLIRVIEISSFQLERIDTFNPRIGIILNITSDHLDRHMSINEYADTKFKLFVNSGMNSWGIFNIDDKYISDRLKRKEDYFSCEMKIIKYSLKEKNNSEVYFSDNKVFYSICGKNGEIDLSEVMLPGKHNISNIMSAVSAAKILGVEDSNIEKIIGGFKTLEHRLEFIGEISGIRVFNDSKATNPDATVKALGSFDGKITLILGGKDKDMDFSFMIPCLNEKVSNIILLGETKQKISEAIESYRKSKGGVSFDVISCNSLKEAVDIGFSVTKRGEILLLSPACASFDMFEDYRDRGKKFKKFVMNKKNGTW